MLAHSTCTFYTNKNQEKSRKTQGDSNIELQNMQRNKTTLNNSAPENSDSESSTENNIANNHPDNFFVHLIFVDTFFSCPRQHRNGASETHPTGLFSEQQHA